MSGDYIRSGVARKWLRRRLDAAAAGYDHGLDPTLMLRLLDKSRSIAPPGYSRWLIPPAALCIHLSIGQAYAWSVFNIPLTRLIGVNASAPGDWSRSQVIWIFSLAIVFLGLSAAFGGKWLERAGPRKAMFASACCFGGGFLVSALGVELHSLPLIYLGYGVIGGIGLGLGYISPVSTLIRWFPDRPGMATGMAIMGFGGGAMIGSPLGEMLMAQFRGPSSVGVAPTFLVMGCGYFLFMLIGAAAVRVPPPGWKPAGYVPPAQPKKMVTSNHVHADQAIRTPQFWLLWCVLCLNVTAGIGILAKASDMMQDIFGVTAIAGAGFAGLLSLPNMLGRFFWSSVSDYTGRKIVYGIYFGLGLVLYAMLPGFAHRGGMAVYVLLCVLIMTMYGGGFATVPAYLRDVFGTMHVGAIHGRLLTAWSLAGVAGPVLLTHFAEAQKQSILEAFNAAKAAGTLVADARPDYSGAYNSVMYLMAGLLLLGFICNALMKPVHESHHHIEEDLAVDGAIDTLAGDGIEDAEFTVRSTQPAQLEAPKPMKLEEPRDAAADTTE